MSSTIQSLNKTAPQSIRRGTPDLVSGARLAASLLFLTDGMTFGTWAALIPSFQQKFQLSPGKISVVLLGMITGAMISMPVAGKLIGRWGSHRLASPAAVGFASTLLLLAFAPSFPMLVGIAMLFGIWKGALDVSINSQAITVEQAVGRPINGSFQGFWSFGGLSSAAILSFLMHQGFSPGILMTSMGTLLLIPAVWSCNRLLPDAAPVQTTGPSQKTGKSNLLWLLGALAFLALFSEGVMFDWSAVYIHTVGKLSVAQSPMGFAAFALCMATGRFLGDLLAAKVGPVNTLRISGFILVSGIAVAVLAHYWLAILLGFALVGFGTANIVPVIFSATGKLAGRGTGANLAAVTTMGYFGFLSGPPLIGFVAALTGLPMALSLVIVSGTIIATVGAAIVRHAATGQK